MGGSPGPPTPCPSPGLCPLNMQGCGLCAKLSLPLDTNDPGKMILKSRGELYVRPPFQGEHKVRPYEKYPFDG